MSQPYKGPEAPPVYPGDGEPPTTNQDKQNFYIFMSIAVHTAAFLCGVFGITSVRRHNLDPWGHESFDDNEWKEDPLWCMQRIENRGGASKSHVGWATFISSVVFFVLSFLLLDIAGYAVHGMTWWKVSKGQVVAYACHLIGFALLVTLFDISASMGCGPGDSNDDDLKHTSEIKGGLSLDAGSALAGVAISFATIGWALLFRELQRRSQCNLLCCPSEERARGPGYYTMVPPESSGDAELAVVVVKAVPPPALAPAPAPAAAAVPNGATGLPPTGEPNKTDQKMIEWAKATPQAIRTGFQFGGHGGRTPPTDVGAYALATLCPNIQDIYLSYTPVTDAGALAIAAGCPNLTRIDMFDTQVTDVGAMAIVASCPKLKRIQFGKTQVTDQFALAIAASCPNVTWIGLNRNGGVTNVGAQAIAASCPNLTHFYLHDTPVTSALWRQIKAMRPGLKG